MDQECIETNYPSIKALSRAAGKLEVYIRNKRADDPQRCRAVALRQTGLLRVRGERHQHGWASALASVSRCSGQNPARISCRRRGRASPTARSEASSNSGIQD